METLKKRMQGKAVLNSKLAIPQRAMYRKRDTRSRITMTQLSPHKQRPENICMRPRVTVFLAIICLVSLGRHFEYTFVRRVETDVDTKTFSDVTYFHNSQNLDNGEMKEKMNGFIVKAEQLGIGDTPISLRTDDSFRISNGEASSSSIPANFFSIIADPRSGAEYAMNILDEYESICSSGTFPKSALMPNTMPWLENDSMEKGCTLAYVRESVLDILSKPNVESKCSKDYDASNDDYRNHIERFCSIIKALDGDHTSEAITRLFIKTFAESNTSEFTGCDCPATTEVRVLKVSADWIGGTLPFETSYIKGSKMIRLTRQNLFERYMSFIIAHATGQWIVRNEMDKSAQLKLFREKAFFIDVDDMLGQVHAMQESDRKTEQWVKEIGSQILWIDHSQIRDDPVRSFKKIIEFFGEESRDGDAVARYMSRLEQRTKEDGSLSLFSGKKLLEYIVNRDQVQEALWAHGYGSFVGLHEEYQPLHYLVFPDSHKQRIYNSQRGLKITILNAKRQSNSLTVNEPSARFLAAIPVLSKLPRDAVVVLTSGKADGINPHVRRSAAVFDNVSKIRALLQASNKITTSVSDECCSDAMINAQPGAFFLQNGHRDARTCKVGECKTSVSSDTKVWSEIMAKLSNGQNANPADPLYVDGSFIVGTAGNMLNVIEQLDVLPWEDDRAILTDFMYRFPDKIGLDYEQRWFAPSFDGVRSKMNLECSSEYTADDFHGRTVNTSSFFVFKSRQMQNCERKDYPEPYPQWDWNGIQIKPILEHIDRVLTQDVSMGGIDRHFDKEILYAVDNKGIWASEVHRDKYRVQPTEKFLLSAQQALQADRSAHRWSNLKRVIQSTGFPYWAWYGDWKDCNHRNMGELSIPLFTTCASTACNHSFPMPSYMTIIDSQPDTQGWYRMYRQFDEKYPWDEKIRRVLWRGALSENNPHRVFDSQRWRLCKLVNSLTDPKEKSMFDVGFTNIPEFLTEQIDIDASIVGGIVKGVSSMNDFQKYFAVLDMDGNSWSSRFGTMLCYNSVAMKVEPAYADYFFYDLVPWKHYIPIKNDLSDLMENVAFVLDPANESIMKEIVASANHWCAERFTLPGLIHDMLDIWERYVQLLDREDPNWSRTWEEKKIELFSTSSNVSLVQLG